MDSNTAKELLKTLEVEMESNGYGSVLHLAKTRLEEYPDIPQDLETNFEWRLEFILKHSILTLETLSSSSIKGTIEMMNEHLDTKEGKVLTGIEVELLDGDLIDLSALPDYSDLISHLKKIQNLLQEL